jgi:DNA end-binding protein Ku
VVDLLAALQRSVEAAKTGRGEEPAAEEKPAKKKSAPTKKPAAKKKKAS